MSTIKHLATVLASSSLSEKELREALTQLFKAGTDQLLYAIHEIRSKRDVSSCYDKGSVSPRNYSDHSGDYTTDVSKEGLQRVTDFEDVAIQVEHLLRVEAKLTSDQAEKRLLSAFPPGFIPLKLPSRSKSKMSFREWVKRFARLVPPRELLRAATLIRNEAVRSDSSDWPLKR